MPAFSKSPASQWLVQFCFPCLDCYFLFLFAPGHVFPGPYRNWKSSMPVPTSGYNDSQSIFGHHVYHAISDLFLLTCRFKWSKNAVLRVLARKELNVMYRRQTTDFTPKPRETNEAECSHVKHVCETNVWKVLYMLPFLPCYRTSHCRLWNVEGVGVPSVECEESGVLSEDCSM